MDLQNAEEICEQSWASVSPYLVLEAALSAEAERDKRKNFGRLILRIHELFGLYRRLQGPLGLIYL
jgi:hypothetical protein